jgi:hypothetical protein
MGKSSVSMGHFPVCYVNHNQRVIRLEPADEGGLVGIFVRLQIQVKHPSILLFIMVGYTASPVITKPQVSNLVTFQNILPSFLMYLQIPPC